MTDQAETTSRPWRRFLRFSVRGLIVLVLVIGAWMGWLVRSARIQREAVAAITKAGGLVMYDWDRSNGKLVPGAEPWAPKWLVDLIGVDYFGRVASVDLRLCKDKTDALMAQVAPLTRLEQLSLSGSTLGDAGLSHLNGLANLSELDLFHTHVTDAGLPHLQGLTKLSQLDLTHTKVSDAGMSKLKRLTQLSTLDVMGTNVSDAGVKELQRALPNLTIYR